MQLFIKRDDLLHPEGDEYFCGNKWRKLKYNLIKARAEGHQQLLTFGGAFSNHIAAVASAGQLFGFKTIGIIRGEAQVSLNPTLQHAEAMGMRLVYWDRARYREKENPAAIAALKKSFGSFYLLPEGGTNALALQGVGELVSELRAQIKLDHQTYLTLSCGTGGTMAGVILALQGQANVIGFPALKGDFLQTEIENLLLQPGKKLTSWSLQTTYHFGGYAKHQAELLSFMHLFKANNDIKLDPIYTGKLGFGVHDLIQKGYFLTGSTIIMIHTGGLQGIKGFQQRFPGFLDL